jgi:hypothetical protein
MRPLAILLLLTACSSTPAPAAPSKAGLPDPANCAAACEHLQALGCEEGKPLEDGTTCTKFCEDSQTSGHALKAGCVQEIQICAELATRCGG